MHHTKRGVIAATVITALIAASTVLGAAAPASAAQLIPDNEINDGDYTFAITPTSASGFDEDFGSSVLYIGPYELRISTGCPVGYRASSRSFIVTPDGTETGVAVLRSNADAELWGLKGNPITLIGRDYVASFETLDETTLPTGVNRLVITCDAERGDPDGVIGDSKYFVGFIEVDRATDSWKQVPRPTENTGEKTATTTTLTAGGVTATSATLTATVAPADATGTVTFKNNDTPIGAPAAVGNGTATVSVSGLAPATAHSFTAEYSGDATHEASTGSASATTLPVADSSSSDVTVTVPTETPGTPSGLTISTKPEAVVLAGSGARTQGQEWTAAGQLGNVTVTDDRQRADAGAWTLSGSSSAFTSGENTIAASHLGWTPVKVDGAGTAGDAATDLSSAKPLATGVASATVRVTTTVAAGLALVVPSGAAAGDYSATLTLTLI